MPPVFLELSQLASHVPASFTLRRSIPDLPLCPLLKAGYLLQERCDLYPLVRLLDDAVAEHLRSLCLSKHDFELVRTIGRGHFGEVHVVRDKHSSDVYAMKTLRKVDMLAQENVSTDFCMSRYSYAVSMIYTIILKFANIHPIENLS
jgi:serine/threonine protein kinase